MSLRNSPPRVFLTFAVLAIPLTALLHLDLRPRPIYPLLEPVPGSADPAFASGEPVQFELEAPDANITGFYLPNLIWRDSQEVSFSIENLTSGKPISQQLLTVANRQPRFVGANAEGDRIRVAMRWIPDEPPVLKPTIRVAAGGESITVDQPLSGLERGVAAKFEFEAPAAGLTEFEMEDLLADPHSEVAIEIRNLTSGDLIKKFSAKDGQKAFRELKSANAKGDRIEVELLWRTLPAPALLASSIEPTTPFAGFPALFKIEYAWPTLWLHLLWIPAGALSCAAFRRHTLIPIALIGLGLAATVSSHLGWQQLYGFSDSHFDPDRFGDFARRLAEWVQNPASRELNELFLSGWRYSWLPLTPLLIAAQQLLGISGPLAYVNVVTLASFGSALLVRAILRRSFGLSEASAFAGVILFLTHHFFLKSFAKPSTDPLGLTLVLASLFLVAERLRHPASRRAAIWLVVVVFLHFFARPPGFVFAAITVAAAILADWLRERKFNPLQITLTGVKSGLAPLAAVAGLFVVFGWFDNFDTAFHSAEDFHHGATLDRFAFTTLSLLQLLPILWLFAGRQRLRQPAAWLLLGWAGIYLGLIVFIKAAFVSRMFLPMLMTPVIFAALGLDRFRPKPIGWALLAVSAGVNVGVVVYMSLLPANPPAGLAPWIAH